MKKELQTILMVVFSLAIYAQTLVKDIRPGASGSNLALLTTVGDTLYLVANDGTNGTELWMSDGTLLNTSMVKNINPSGNAFFTEFEPSNGKLFFSGGPSFGQDELWVSDGTSSGTVMVKDINPGTASSGPSYMVDINGTIYFQANDGTNGKELWKSDGTTAGTVMVKDIVAGSGHSSPNNLTNFNGTLFLR